MILSKQQSGVIVLHMAFALNYFTLLGSVKPILVEMATSPIVEVVTKLGELVPDE